jgi:hypothetical protein
MIKFIENFFKDRNDEMNKLIFRRLILLMIFMSLLSGFIPTIFSFEKYYGLSRFVDQGYIVAYLGTKFELYIAIFMSFFSLTSLILIYFFVSVGKYFFLLYLLINFVLLMFGGDVINYGVLYPIEWVKNVIEAYLIYLMFFGANKKDFEIIKSD